MPCFRPLKGWYSKVRNKDTGKRSVVFVRHEGLTDLPVTVPCGKCIGCRLAYAKQWAIRCLHESKIHKNKNCFITLTYNDEHLPKNGSLCKKDFQKFIKRLRKNNQGKQIKYFHCGEYGENTGRPHYHAILFNYDFEDKTPCLYLKDTGHYVSKSLEKLWPLGFSLIGEVNFETCCYVARYCVKADYTQELDEMYSDLIHQGKEKPYLTMSRPRKKDGRSKAIGAEFYYKYGKTDIYERDEIIIKNFRKTSPPKFYDSLLELDNPELLGKLKAERRKKHEDNPHNKGFRLDQRGRVAFLRSINKKRDKC